MTVGAKSASTVGRVPEASSGVVIMKDFLIKVGNGDKGYYTGPMKKLEKSDINESVDFIPHGKGSVLFNKAKGVAYEGYFKDGHFHG